MPFVYRRYLVKSLRFSAFLASFSLCFRQQHHSSRFNHHRCLRLFVGNTGWTHFRPEWEAKSALSKKGLADENRYFSRPLESACGCTTFSHPFQCILKRLVVCWKDTCKDEEIYLLVRVEKKEKKDTCKGSLLH